MSLGDVLLDWVSEVGAGSWAEAKDGIKSLQRGEERPRDAWKVVADLEDAGHMDVDWDSRKWSASAPTLCLLRNTSLCAVWSGARPRKRRRSLIGLMLENPSVFDFEVPQGQGPSAHFIKAGSIDDLRSCASDLQLTFVVDAASQIARRLSASLPGLERRAAVPTVNEDLRWFDPRRLRWIDVDAPLRTEGLFEVSRYGRRFTRWQDGHCRWWETDRPAGLFRAVRGGGDELLRWRAAEHEGREPSMFEVHHLMHLPPVARRAAVASSGLLPLREGGWVRFRNVDRRVAERIARSVEQPLRIVSRS